ncbi:rCG54249 [Rattus norvegicus]|uniref:RCG54249 n=1 Tax=Rattus norvegicus TaxID=10116 RepID=A6J8J8_RAT|nr:rCG54249 [Rattus norvegicus]
MYSLSAPPMCVHRCVYLCSFTKWGDNEVTLPLTSWGFHSQLSFLVSVSVRGTRLGLPLYIHLKSQICHEAAYAYWASLKKPDCPLALSLYQR